MRVSLLLSAVVLSTGINAAPVANPTPGLLSGLLTAITNDLNKLLTSLGVKLRTDAAKHGATINYHDQSPFTFPVVTPSLQRFVHDVIWGKGVNGANFINWRTFKANGANLGGWLEKEKTHDPIWWDSVGGADAPDEWTLCDTLGNACGPAFEARYASFLNTSTIDQLASVGVNTLRIPTTYAARINVPSSKL